MLALGACSDAGSAPRDALTPAQMTLYRDGVHDAESTRARARDLPAPPPGRVDVAAGPTALARRTERQLADPSSPSGPTTMRLQTATDDISYGLLCSGRVDVVETVRPLADSERAACAAVGLDVVQLAVATEATAVVVDRAASLDACVTTDQLAGMLADPPTVTSWTQLGLATTPLSARGVGLSLTARLDWLLGSEQQRDDAAALSQRLRVRADYRARLAGLRAASDRALAALDQVRRERDAGERGDAAVVAARAAADAAHTRRARVRGEYDGVAARYDAAVSAQRAEEARRGRVVLLPYADYLDERDRTTALEVAAGPTTPGCVRPEPVAIASGDYPLSRPVLLTTTLRSWRRPEVAAYLDAYLRATPRLARATGRVPATTTALAGLSDRVRDDDPPVLGVDPVAEPTAAALPPPPAP